MKPEVAVEAWLMVTRFCENEKRCQENKVEGKTYCFAQSWGHAVFDDIEGFPGRGPVFRRPL